MAATTVSCQEYRRERLTYELKHKKVRWKRVVNVVFNGLFVQLFIKVYEYFKIISGDNYGRYFGPCSCTYILRQNFSVRMKCMFTKYICTRVWAFQLQVVLNLDCDDIYIFNVSFIYLLSISPLTAQKPAP